MLHRVVSEDRILGDTVGPKTTLEDSMPDPPRDLDEPSSEHDLRRRRPGDLCVGALGVVYEMCLPKGVRELRRGERE